MSLARRVLSNTIIQFVGRAVTTLLGIASIALLTRSLGVAGYGDYATVFAFVSFFSVLADAGFFVILLRELSKTGADEARLVGNVLTVRTVLAVCVFALAAVAGWFVPQYSGVVRHSIVVLAVASLWTTMNQTLVAVFQRHLRMEYAVLTELVSRGVLLALLWLVLERSPSLVAVFWAYVVANVLNFTLSAFFVRRFVRVRLNFDVALWWQIARDALPIGIVLILHVIYFRVDTLFLSLMKGSVDVGVYGAPYKIVEVLLTLPAMFLGNLFPTFTAYLEQRDLRIGALFERAVTVLAFIAAPVLILGIVFAFPVLRFVAGDLYVTTSTVTWLGVPATGVVTLQLLLVAIVCAFFSSLANYLLVAAGRQRALVVPNVVFVVVNMVLNAALIPRFSYVGAALATIATECVSVVYLYALLHRYTGLRAPLRRAAATLLPALVAGMIGWVTLPYSFFLAVATAVVGYGIVGWWLGIVPALLAPETRHSQKNSLR